MSKTLAYIKQSILFLFEIIFIVSLLTLLSTILFPITDNIQWSLIERCITFFTIYQIITYSTLKLMNDAQKDSYNTLKLHYENALLYFEILNYDINSAEKYKEIILSQINIQYRNDLLNPQEVIDYYNKLKKYINDKDIIAIKYELNNINHLVKPFGFRIYAFHIIKDNEKTKHLRRGFAKSQFKLSKLKG